MPWHVAAAVVGRAPSLDYVVTVLANAHCAATFTGLDDESFFYQTHVRIERAAAPAVGALVRAAREASSGVSAPSTPAELTRCLAEVAEGVRAMAEVMPEMTAGCRPRVFHDAIRQRLAGVPGPVAFEGVRGQPLSLTGASGAQSAILPCVDALLGIGHTGPYELREWSVDEGGLTHLPPAHRRLLCTLRRHAPASTATIERMLRDLEGGAAGPAAAEARALRAAHAACIDALVAFRKAHFALVRAFIVEPSDKTPSGDALDDAGRGSPVSVTAPLRGTGGSQLGAFLSGRLLDTARASLASADSHSASPARWVGARRAVA